jgi:AcrR family transcriptional regulator
MRKSRPPRKLTLKVRAERQKATRRRITEAAMALHEAVGPAEASITAIAKKAGVQRLTVYRHFPDTESLLKACGSHYMTAHPPPDPSVWLAVDDPEERLAVALTGLYRYFRSTAAMNGKLMRDAKVMPEVAMVMEGYRNFVAVLTDLLARGLKPDRPDRVLSSAVAHALDFETWQALTSRLGLTDEEAVRLMSGMVRAMTRG